MKETTSKPNCLLVFKTYFKAKEVILTKEEEISPEV